MKSNIVPFAETKRLFHLGQGRELIPIMTQGETIHAENPETREEGVYHRSEFVETAPPETASHRFPDDETLNPSPRYFIDEVIAGVLARDEPPFDDAA